MSLVFFDHFGPKLACSAIEASSFHLEAVEIIFQTNNKGVEQFVQKCSCQWSLSLVFTVSGLSHGMTQCKHYKIDVQIGYTN